MTTNHTHICEWAAALGPNSFYISTLLSLAILFENLLGILTIWRTPALHTNANRFMVSLALTDIIVGFDFLIGGIAMLHEWMPQVVRAVLVSFLLGCTMGMITLSCVHMAVIAVDRYIYITLPFYYMTKVTKTRVVLVILFIWTASVAYVLAFFIENVTTDWSRLCNIFIDPPPGYLVSIMVIYAIDVLIIFTCYFKIARLAFRRRRNAGKARNLDITILDAVVWNKKNQTAMLKSVKFFFVMFGVFFLCTAVPGTAAVVRVFYDLPSYVLGILLFMYGLNSGMNFIIYAYMSKDFLRALRSTVSSLFKCCCKR